MTEVPGPLSELVERTALNEPYWLSLEKGHLSFQRCTTCSNAWLPPRDRCPNCLDDNWTWEIASGRGHLVSWMVYHHAYNKYVANRVPYNVALVALEEGPQLITNLVGAGSSSPQVDAPVELVVELEGDLHVAHFQLA